jgi:phosphoglucosamine mutase
LIALDNVFRQYDIRGEYPYEINEEFAEKLGLATANYLSNSGTVIVGCDFRPSGSRLRAALISGLMRGGVTVVDISPCTTDMLTFATVTSKPDLSIMVTASHLPLKYNGFKYISNQGVYLSQEERSKIKGILVKGEFKEGKGKVERLNVVDKYLSAVKRLMNWSGRTLSGIKLVTYPMGGTAILTLPKLLEDLGAEVYVIREVAEDPEPKDDNTTILREEVLAKKGLLGLINDGDGDRLAARNHDGSYITGDHLLCIFAKLYSKLGKVVITIDSSSAVFEYVRGELIVSKVGEANYVIDAIKHGAIFGGEPSGHFVDLRFTPSGSGTLFAAILAEIAKRGDLDKMLAEIPKFYTYRVKVVCKDRLTTMSRVVAELEREGVEILSRIDGVKYRIGGATVLIRPSNTEQVVRATVESKDAEEAKSMLGQVEDMLRRFSI